MHRPVQRSAPAQVVAAIIPLPQAHAARWHNRVSQRPVVDFDEVDSVAQAAVQGPLANRPGGRSPQGQPIRAGGEVLQPDIVAHIGQNPGLVAFHGSSRRINWPKMSSLMLLAIGRTLSSARRNKHTPGWLLPKFLLKGSAADWASPKPWPPTREQLAASPPL